MTHQIISITIFSNSLDLIQGISSKYEVKAIVLETQHFRRDVYDFACLRSIPFLFANTKSDLSDHLGVLPECDLGVAFGFSLKFDAEARNFFRFGIWNIHPGSLPENRGRHPITWDFLENSQHFTVTIHEVDDSFDRGFLLASKEISREVKDTASLVESRLVSAVTNSLFTEAIDSYFSGRKKPIGEGNYRKPIGDTLSEVQPELLDSRRLFNVVMSQADFGGVKVGSSIYTECTFVHENFRSLYEDYFFVRSRDGKLMGLR